MTVKPSEELTVTLTYKFRLRDRHAAELNRQARAVNVVWNYCNETQQKAVTSGRKWLTAIDLQRLTAGASTELNVHAHTIQKVCQRYDQSRKQHRKAWLRFRGVKSLGWVPFNKGHVRFDGNAFVFRGLRYTPMHSRGLREGTVLSVGSFNRDSRGRWYLNAAFNVDVATQAPVSKVGVDLGLKDFATLSDGRKIQPAQFYRKSEAALVTAQRARKSKREKAIHSKIANRRRDFLHKASRALVKEHGLIVIGNVSPSKLAQTVMAKSVLDAGWADFKRMLSYKSLMNGGSTLEVSEYRTTQTCSNCGSLPQSRPRGIAGLRNRVWRCDHCSVVHDRDVNAARNILAIGLDSLGGGAHV